jgi:hypothetical protein
MFTHDDLVVEPCQPFHISRRRRRLWSHDICQQRVVFL